MIGEYGPRAVHILLAPLRANRRMRAAGGSAIAEKRPDAVESSIVICSAYLDRLMPLVRLRNIDLAVGEETWWPSEPLEN